METQATTTIQAVTMADCQSLVELSTGIGFQVLIVSCLFVFSVGFFLGRSFLTERSAVFDVRLRRHSELFEDDN